MKCLSIFILSTLLFVNLIAQIDEQQIAEQIAALEDSVKVKIEQYGEKNEAVVNAYFDLLDVLYKYEKNDEGIKFAKKSLDVCLITFGNKHASTSIAYHKLGRIYFVQAIYSKALEHFEKALTIRLNASGEMDSLTAEYFQEIGEVYCNTGDYTEALDYLQKAVVIFSKIFSEKHINTGQSFSVIGHIYMETGNYTKALNYYEKALEIELDFFGEMHNNIGASYNNIGVLHYLSGNYSKALAFYFKALAIVLEISGEMNSRNVSTFNNIGAVYSKTGDYAKALKYFEKALTIGSEIFEEKHPLIAQSFSNLGLLHTKTGDYYIALKYFEKAIVVDLEIFGEKHNYLATDFNNIGKVFSKIGNHSKALEYHQKSIEILLEIFGEKHPYTAESYKNLGLVCSEKRDFIESLDYLQKALNIELEILGEKHSYTAESYKNLGLVYYKKKDFIESLDYLQKALNIELEIFIEKHPSLINTQVSLANTFEALTYFNQADSLWNIIIPNIEDQLSKNYLFLADDKKLLYLETIEKTLTSFYNFIDKYGSEQSKLLASNLLINTKSQILDYSISTRQLIENIKDENLDSIAFQLNNINRKVAKAELLTKEELKQKGWRLDSMRLQQDKLALQILEHSQLKAKIDPPKFSWQQIQDKLQADEALIDYFTFYNKVDSAWVFHAMLLKKNEPKPIFIPLSLMKPVDDLLKTKDHFPIYLQYKEARQELHAHIWQALEPNLKDINTIHLTPVASLNKIDFGSLQNEEGQFLADLYDFHYYTSSKDFYKQKPGNQIYKDANLYGHIAYYKDDAQQYEAEENSFAMRLLRDTLVALPATLPEVKAIEKICSKHKVSPTLLTINEAKEDTIEYFSANRAPSIMHFATHGAYLPPLLKKEETIATTSLSGQDRFRAADNPLQRSMLMLSNAGNTWKGSGPNIITENDGILTALEVTNLDLSNTELVVLSACNSGIGSQHTTEGVFGLPRAFKLAGVDKILVSLWPVEDETTKELMILFYTNLLQHRQEAATALRNAKAEMRKQDDRPKKWAGFVLVE